MEDCVTDLNGWYDIATAPKDGTKIDVWVSAKRPEYSRREVDVYWAVTTIEFNQSANKTFEGWCHFDSQEAIGGTYPIEDHGDAVTHWRARPVGPNGEQKVSLYD